MIVCYRVEHSDGYGMFFKKLWNDKGEVIANRNVFGEKDFPELWVRHTMGFKNPQEDKLFPEYNGRNYFCAFKSITALKYWIDDKHITKLKELGFGIYEIHALDYQEGRYQVLYTKESIVKNIDITNTL